MKHWHVAVATAAVALGAIALVPHHVGPAYLYPDANLTPGVVATHDIAELRATNPTYSVAHRHTTEAQKKAVRAEYSATVCAQPNDCEVDHLCPLALGCADDIKNLWVQPAVNDWQGQDFGYHAKDKLENKLVLLVKAGTVSPQAAQQCILQDWVACYRTYFAQPSTFSSVDTPVDPDN